MSTIFKGTRNPILQREIWDFDPSRGWTRKQSWKGASWDRMQLLQQDYTRNGIACRITYEQGDTALLEIDDSTLTYLIDTWEIIANQESRDGFSHPKMLALATTDQIALMRQHLDNNDTSTIAFTDPVLSNLAGKDPQALYILQELGSTNYLRGQYVLRHRTNAPHRWQANIADIGVDKIYTTAQLLTEVTSTALWIYPLPARMQYKIFNIPVPDARNNYLWGWLKGATTENSAPNNRVDLVTEYTLEQWSTTYYDPH